MRRTTSAAAIGVALMAIGGGVWFWQYTRGPEYSLLMAASAFEDHDLLTFEKHVDIEGVSGSVVDQVYSKIQPDTSKEGLEAAGQALAMLAVQAFKPRIVDAIRNQLVQLVENGDFSEVGPDQTEAASFSASVANAWNRLEMAKDTFQGFEYTKTDGNIALVGVALRSKRHDETLVVDLKMRDLGGYWQVADVPNAGEVLELLRTLEEARTEAANRPIVDQMNNAIAVNEIEKTTTSGKYGLDKKVLFGITLQNNSDRNVTRVLVELVATSIDGIELVRSKINVGDPIGVGGTYVGTWTKDVNMFTKADGVLFATPEADLVIDVEPIEIEFSEGTGLALYAPWEAP